MLMVLQRTLEHSQGSGTYSHKGGRWAVITDSNQGRKRAFALLITVLLATSKNRQVSVWRRTFLRVGVRTGDGNSMMYNASKQRGLVLVVHSAAISSSKMELRNDNRWDGLSSFMPCHCSLPAHFVMSSAPWLQGTAPLSVCEGEYWWAGLGYLEQGLYFCFFLW